MKKVIIFILITVFFCNFSFYPAIAQDMTQLEIREFQTRLYDTNDTKMLMKAIVDTFQDESFIITNINTEMGVITAYRKQSDIPISKKSDTTSPWLLIPVLALVTFCLLMSDTTNNSDKNSNDTYTNNQADNQTKIIKLDATASVTRFNNQSKIRLNFSTNIDEKIDKKFYQEFFSKIDKSIFIQNEKI